MNWDSAVQGALGGGVVGTIAGLVPLGVGILCRERRKGIGGFLGCMLGGAIGGVYASIALMAMSTAYVVQPQGQTSRRTTQWSGLALLTDKIWFLIASCWLFICMFGTMLVSAAFLTPVVLGVPNYVPRDRAGKVLEFVMLFGGLGLGIAVGFIGVSFICRRFISSATHDNWANDFEASTLNRSPLLRKAARCYYGFLLPRNWLARREERAR
jgi:hypothetical protein